MVYAIVLFLTAMFQATFADLIRVANIKPDLLLVLVVFVAIRRGPVTAAAVGAAAGFLTDALSMNGFFNTLVLPVCGIGAGLFNQRFYPTLVRNGRASVLADILIVSGTCILVSFVNLVWFSQWYYHPPLIMLAVRIGIPTVLYTALVTPPVFFILDRLV